MSAQVQRTKICLRLHPDPIVQCKDDRILLAHQQVVKQAVDRLPEQRGEAASAYLIEAFSQLEARIAVGREQRAVLVEGSHPFAKCADEFGPGVKAQY